MVNVRVRYKKVVNRYRVVREWFTVEVVREFLSLYEPAINKYACSIPFSPAHILLRRICPGKHKIGAGNAPDTAVE